MNNFSSQWANAMVDCDVIRNNVKIATCKGLINDTKDHNFISFDADADIQVGDDIYCPIKRKHYIITNTDIALFCGKEHRLDAFFESNFSKPQTTIFNTYNPNNSIIGNQQNATININEAFDNLNNMINQYGNNDKIKLFELSNSLKSELNKNQINKSSFQKFSDLIAKHSWLPLAIAQVIGSWIQRG